MKFTNFNLTFFNFNFTYFNLNLTYFNLKFTSFNLNLTYFNLNFTHFNLNFTHFNLNFTHFNLKFTYFNLKLKRCSRTLERASSYSDTAISSFFLPFRVSSLLFDNTEAAQVSALLGEFDRFCSRLHTKKSKMSFLRITTSLFKLKFTNFNIVTQITTSSAPTNIF